VDSAKPSIDLVRVATDMRVLNSLMHHRRMTRAELATLVGISKPTAGESVRRLTERGLVTDTGERTQGGRGKGRVGSYYALDPSVGVAMAVAIAPEGVVAECLDVYGDTVARALKRIDRPASPHQVSAALQAAAAEIGEVSGRPVRVAVVSAADPVDRETGRLVHLPDAPFLVGELDPVAILAPHTAGPVIVDNDVNWAATAEGRRDFAYLHLGEGLGCAIVDDGVIRRGRSGLAGEIAHLLTIGPGGRAVRFIDLFGELGLRRRHSTAIDVDRLLAEIGADPVAISGTDVRGQLAAAVAAAKLEGQPTDADIVFNVRDQHTDADIVFNVRDQPTDADIVFNVRDQRMDTSLEDNARNQPAGSAAGGVRARPANPAAADVRGQLADAVAGVIAALIALADPEEIVIGGDWGPALIGDIHAATALLPRHAPVRAAAHVGDPVLAGVRAAAVNRLREEVAAGPSVLSA
jgi:predicted NBD/HSP70 family sugar kinase